VISKKAIDELRMTDKCLVCGAPVNIKTDLVNLNYSKEERDVIYRLILSERSKTHDKLLGKKREEKVLRIADGEVKKQKIY
jgi:hypothetical protein